LENTVWLTASQFAALADISPQAARRALRQAAAGVDWRGHVLRVRPRAARGGGTEPQFELCAASLPSDLVRAESSPSRSVERCASPSSAPSITEARWRAIRVALAEQPRSNARSSAVDAAVKHFGWSRRTLYRWIDRYEESGARGLARERSASAAARRVQVSRAFDRAFRVGGHHERLLVQIAAEVERGLKALWTSRAEIAGVNEIRRLAEFLLQETCETRGLNLPKSAMRLSRRTVERFAHYRVVNQRRHDRKAFDDAKPRIRRDWTMLAPMERIVADVKHLDVIVEREDGTSAWPKIVAFMDAGTGRVFVHPLLLEPSEGVRQEHVIEAFLAMVSDTAWGFPQGLYLDNGAEFGALAKIDHALQLINDPGVLRIYFFVP
jgi:transposase-like protein